MTRSKMGVHCAKLAMHDRQNPAAAFYADATLPMDGEILPVWRL
jgi:hypothetical protein